MSRQCGQRHDGTERKAAAAAAAGIHRRTSTLLRYHGRKTNISPVWADVEITEGKYQRFGKAMWLRDRDTREGGGADLGPRQQQK